MKAIWADRSPYRKFLILLGLVLLSTFFSLSIFYILAKPLFGLDLINNAAIMNDFNNPTVISAWKLMQVIQTIGFFIIPPFLMVYFSYQDGYSMLGLNKDPGILNIMLVIALIGFSIPLINWMGYWNERMTLPSFMAGIEEWMKNSEKQLKELSEVLLKADNTGDYLFNLFMIALLPALGEELLFRGLIQKMFGRWTKNIHLAIFITAILFSAMHRQFYGFFPRMMLGVLFGYLFYWSGSLWLPIIAHFMNNAAAVTAYYIIENKGIEIPVDTFGLREGDAVFLILGCMGVTAILWLFHKRNAMKNV